MEPASDGPSGSSPGTTSEQMVPNQLAMLVPAFDPSKDSLEIWTQKVELLVGAWPPAKLSELATRLILGTTGSAFQKLQLHKDELVKNDPKAIKQLVAYLGGQWGKVPLEQRFDAAEKALFRCVQRQDESNDSYLARADVLWSELLAKNMTLAELRAYIVLRGSLLPSEDKKRVLVESGAEASSSLSLDRVSRAIRMLGAGFFQEYAGFRRQKGKTYDQQVMLAEDDDDHEAGIHHTIDDEGQDEQAFVEQLAFDGDSDALLVGEYEAAMSDTLQGDQELASCYNAYAEARYRLSERFRSRGFWPIKGKGKGGKSMSKGKGGRFGKDRRSLEQRILSSHCRKCGQKGHWKSECPNVSSNFSDGRTSSTSAPTASTSYVDVPRDGLPLEFMQLPSVHESPLDVTRQHQVHEVFIMGLSSVNIAPGVRSNRYPRKYGVYNLGRISDDEIIEQRHARNKLHAISVLQKKKQDSMKKTLLPSTMQLRHPNSSEGSESEPVFLSSWEEINFASFSSYGVVDLGASKTVIGSQCLKDLIKALPQNILQKCYRTPCVINFRFGNQGMLTSEWAFVVPLSPQLHLKIAVVSGATPFLLSSALLRTIGAVIDTSQDVMWCRRFDCSVSLHLTDRGLFLLDMKELLQKAWNHHRSSTTVTDLKPVSSCSPTDVSNSTSEIAQKKVSSNPWPKSCEVSESSSYNQVEMCHFTEEGKRLGQTSDGNHKSSSFESEISTAVRMSQTGTPRKCDDHVKKIFQPQGISSDIRVESHCASLRRVPDRPSSQGADSRSSDSSSRHATGNSRESRIGLWTEAQGKEVLGCMGDGSGLDHVVSQPVRQVPRSETSEVCHVHREEDHGTRDHGDHCGQDFRRSSSLLESDSGGTDLGEAKGQDKELSGGQGSPTRASCSRVGGGGRVRHGGPIDGNVCPSTTGCSSSSREDAAHGECTVSDRSAHSEQALNSEDIPDWQLYAGDVDCEFAFGEKFGNHSHERKVFQHLVNQYTHELEQIRKAKARPTRSNLCLVEVFCGPNSQLTRQAVAAGLKAERFGLDQGDLSTCEGRSVLFHLICGEQPEHLWFSPVCRPWSAWSSFNSSQSLEAWDRIYQDRLKGLEQVALGIVLFRFQIEHHRHFHWEQPLRSMMFRLPFMQEVLSYTKMIECDLCEVGDLRDPMNNQHIKKGLLICTTSQRLFDQFHGRRCHHHHPHQTIEGSVHWQGQRISRSKYTEHYPRKFARQIVQVWKKSAFPREKPFSDPIFAVADSTEEPDRPLKRRKLRAIPPKAPHMIEVSELPSVKRRKTDKQPDDVPNIQHAFAEICRKIDDRTPRVGKRQFSDNDEIMKSLQDWFPDKVLVL